MCLVCASVRGDGEVGDGGGDERYPRRHVPPRVPPRILFIPTEEQREDAAAEMICFNIYEYVKSLRKNPPSL